MFLVRRAIWLLRLYTNVLLAAVLIVAVDVDMQARSAGRSIATYDRAAYIATVQKRLRGEPRAGRATPLDVSLLAYQGVLKARLAILGLEAPSEDVALLSDPAPVAPQHGLPVGTTEDGSAKPCVRRNNVLSC